MENRTFEGLVYEWSQKIAKDNPHQTIGGITVSDIKDLKNKVGDQDEALKELLNSMEEEYLKGATAMFNHLRENVTNCDGKDGCSICTEAKKFLKNCSSYTGGTHEK